MSTSAASLVKQGQDLVESAIDKAKQLQESALPLAKNAANKAQSLGQDSLSTLGDMASQARDAVWGVSDSVISYTKKNPAKALGLAAAAGAVCYVLLKALTPSRD